ncbi:MAG TPA: tRNA pseudouridine(55) synthase TruB [Candidatus Dormibacteraeota bacterium]|nr:tRNA pseudouridine(55) synthase TruB [Candidatus Dormibacteraeota bacterium]
MGILNLDKPAGISSNGALTRLKRATGEKRLGHAGTLDPMATGVLPVFFGRATVLVDHLLRAGKAYEAAIRLGAASDTDDAMGTLTPVPVPPGVDAAAVEAALPAFVGRIRQRPPAYSAVKVDGRRSYALARRSDTETPVLAEREVEVHAIRLLDFEPSGLVRVAVECGSGFYVRALARDLAAALGTAGHLEALRRTRVGGFDAAAAVTLAAAEALGPGLAETLLPPAAVLAGVSRVEVGPSGTVPLHHGGDVPAPGAPDGEAWAADEVGRVLALGRVSAGRFQPRRLVELA